MIVNCKTQKEWSHVCEIIKYGFDVGSFKYYPCINTTKDQCCSLRYYQNIGESIISYEEFLKLKNINIMKYKEGDIIFNTGGDKRKILGVCGQVYFVSSTLNFNSAAGLRTEGELTNYQLYEENPVKEVTLADISKAMNIPLDKLRIKE